MTTVRRYVSGIALRTALEDRLKKIAVSEAVDLQRLRRQVAFDRFLARLFQVPDTDWVLKGGYAMELRFETARATKDLDFTVKSAVRGADDSLLGFLQEIGSTASDDFFVFRVGRGMMDLDGAPYGGRRYPVEAILAGRTFVKFHVDVGLGDIVMEPLDQVVTRDWLSFAGIAAPAVRMISPEQQFAEKLHAYTLPRGEMRNSRVRDLVDLILLIRSERLSAEQLRSALRRTFSRRNTHILSVDLTSPPEEWDEPFQALASECKLALSADRAFEEVAAYIAKMNL